MHRLLPPWFSAAACCNTFLLSIGLANRMSLRNLVLVEDDIEEGVGFSVCHGRGLRTFLTGNSNLKIERQGYVTLSSSTPLYRYSLDDLKDPNKYLRLIAECGAWFSALPTWLGECVAPSKVNPRFRFTLLEQDGQDVSILLFGAVLHAFQLHRMESEALSRVSIFEQLI